MSPSGTAVVGAGLMGRWHAHALGRLGRPLVAVVDPDGARARRLAGRYDARAESSIAAVLADESIGFVHVCSPAETHVDLVRAALEAGRHVLVEKPLTRDPADTQRLLELAEARGSLLCPVHQFGFQDGFLALLASLDRIGPLVDIAFVACSAGALGRPAHEADGIAADILPHPLSLFARLLPQPIDALDWAVQRPAAGELRAQAIAGTASLAITISMRARPTLNQLTIRGERGAARLDLFHGYAVLEGGGVSRAHKIARPFLTASKGLTAAAANLSRRTLRREPAYPGLRELIGRFHDAGLTGRSSPIPPGEVLGVAHARARVIGQLGQVGPATGRTDASVRSA